MLNTFFHKICWRFKLNAQLARLQLCRTMTKAYVMLQNILFSTAVRHCWKYLHRVVKSNIQQPDCVLGVEQLREGKNLKATSHSADKVAVDAAGWSNFTEGLVAREREGCLCSAASLVSQTEDPLFPGGWRVLLYQARRLCWSPSSPHLLLQAVHLRTWRLRTLLRCTQFLLITPEVGFAGVLSSSECSS